MSNNNPILNNPYKPPVYHYATEKGCSKVISQFGEESTKVLTL
ncbi:MAG: hypothetical protein ABIR18_15565 [Chitinophagaceae bacterium]